MKKLTANALQARALLARWCDEVSTALNRAPLERQLVKALAEKVLLIETNSQLHNDLISTGRVNAMRLELRNYTNALKRELVAVRNAKPTTKARKRPRKKKPRKKRAGHA